MIKCGFEPMLECSTRGDKRFSALVAVVNNKTIEEQYQAAKVFADGSTGLSVKDARGRTCINYSECAALYSSLWDQYFDEHPELINVIMQYRGFSDMFGKANHACQAKEIYRIWLKHQTVLCEANMSKYGHLIVHKSDHVEGAVYCGRGRGSAWGNEYSHLPNSKATWTVGSREEAVVQHRMQFISDIKSGVIKTSDVAKLAGKKLECYCAPLLCHCSTLAAAAAYYARTLN